MYDASKKKSLVVLGLLLSAVVTAFGQAATGTGTLQSALGTILGFFQSGYMKAILAIALGGLAIGLIANRGEPGVMKKFIPWIAACILLLSLSAITNIVFPSTGSDIQADTSRLNF